MLENYVSNRLVVLGDLQERIQFEQRGCGYSSRLCLSSLIRPPLCAPLGWYYRKWGTPSDILDVVREVVDGGVVFQFKSRQDTPALAIKSVAKDFPLLTFGMASEDLETGLQELLIVRGSHVLTDRLAAFFTHYVHPQLGLECYAPEDLYRDSVDQCTRMHHRFEAARSFMKDSDSAFEQAVMRVAVEETSNPEYYEVEGSREPWDGIQEFRLRLRETRIEGPDDLTVRCEKRLQRTRGIRNRRNFASVRVPVRYSR